MANGKKDEYRSWVDLCGFRIGYTGEFYGIRGIALISHGGWADPELVYEGKSYNYYDVEDPMWDLYCEEHPDADSTGDEAFQAWMQENAEYVKGCLDDLDNIGAYYGAPSLAYPM